MMEPRHISLTHFSKTYDYLLTFEREVGLVWRSPLSIVNVLFFISRYTPFAEGTMVFFRRWCHGPPWGLH